MQVRWHPNCHLDHRIPANWVGSVDSNLAASAPVVQLSNLAGENRLTFALAEASRMVKINTGICEETCEIAVSIELFSVPEAPLTDYETVLRLDWRTIFYADALRNAFAWFATFPEYLPAVAPDAAFEPIYSSWYSYHQNLFDHQLESECQLAREYGLKGIIVDDGWQTDDTNRGYAFCGDWEVSLCRFPDMRAHVTKVHQMGMKYVVWYSVPFVGEKSKNLPRFRAMTLYRIDTLNTYVLDPRFPEVRQFLIGTYEKALQEWDIDGFKLDFIDSFRFEGEDPAIKDNYAGRDIQSLPEAVDRLLSDTMNYLRRIKPDILIEFRQSYIGPAVRKYGNMLRVGDCPGDILSNRVGSINLRLSSGYTAVHSDMLEWHPQETPESAARQLLNVLFAVPQISVRLEELPDDHRRMLRFWLCFWRDHRYVLMHGKLNPSQPELNYPQVSADNQTEQVIAVYGSGQKITVSGEPGKTYYLVNAGGDEELIMALNGPPNHVTCHDVLGNKIPTGGLPSGLAAVKVPISGLLTLQY